MRAAWDRRGLIALFVLILPLVTPKIRGADEIEYFASLRSLVFDHDLELGNEYRRFYEADPRGLAGFKATFLDLREPRTGRHISFAPIGSALLWSPFYLAAHAAVAAARAVGWPLAADGFSWPYVAAACYASALYGFGGLLLAHDGLRRFGGFGEPAAAAAVAAAWLGTPVFYYMTLAPAFSHALSLFMVSALVWLWLDLRGREEAPAWRWALLGVVGGVAGMVREQDLLFLAVPAADLAGAALARRGRGPVPVRVLALLAGAAVGFVPQLLAYRALNGTFAPSTLVRRKMAYGSPHFLEVLFDPAHGLFAWSPLLLAATAGLLFAALFRRDQVSRLLAWGLLVQVWVNGAVESWTQAGAFGSRRFVGATAVFAWGLAVLLARVPRPGLLAAGVALAAWWNLSLMVQFGLRLMDRQGLEWPRVAVNQVTEVPPRLARSAWLFLTDRERLVRESR